jgi:ATP-dependent DNA helicase RecG
MLNRGGGCPVVQIHTTASNKITNSMNPVIRLNTIDDLAGLAESVDVECKLAAGADGKGRLPREFWPTYSAFANTRGGVILLGIREDSGRFAVHGIEEVDRVITDLFNTVNNPDKVSINLLADTHVRRVTIDGRELVAVEVYHCYAH